MEGLQKAWRSGKKTKHSGWLVTPHKWSGKFFKTASLWQAPCRPFSKQFLLNALRVQTCYKFKEEWISEREYATSLGSVNQRVLWEGLLMLELELLQEIDCYRVGIQPCFGKAYNILQSFHKQRKKLKAFNLQQCCSLSHLSAAHLLFPLINHSNNSRQALRWWLSIQMHFIVIETNIRCVLQCLSECIL